MRAMKIICAIIIIAAVAAGGFYLGFRTGSTRDAGVESEEPSWKDLYAGVLRTYIDPEFPDSSFAKFNLYDLDGDGTPELIVSEGEFHMCEAEIFTVYRGVVYCLGSFGSWGDFGYAPETGYIYSGMTGQGVTYTTIHQIVDGRARELVSFYDTTGYYADPEDGSYEVDGEEVSQEEYNRAWEKYGGNTDDDFTARKYDVNEDEITRVLNLPY